jgi:Uma2 family endonuclease
MYAVADLEARDDRPTEDHVVWLSDVSWDDYVRILEIRGDRSAPRISYLEGTLEIMSPSRDHETIKSLIGCLIEAYCLEAGIKFLPVGSWTLKERAKERGTEPDECYLLGDVQAQRPHLAIEVIWTSGRLDKLEVYRKLGVQEVWVWRKGRIQVHGLRGERYDALDASEVLPGLDIGLLTRFLDRPTAYDAIRDFRAALSKRAT